MQNIRKTLEERLDNALLDLYNPVDEVEYGHLHGQIEAYQDCLNLFPTPRTETNIINDLKALGWRYQPQRLSYEYKFYNKGNVIEIRGGDKVIAYEENYFPDDEPNYQPICIDYDVYKLIFELLNLEEE